MPPPSIRKAQDLGEYLSRYAGCDDFRCTTCGGMGRALGSMNDYKAQIGPLWEVLAAVTPFTAKAAERFRAAWATTAAMLESVMDTQEREAVVEAWCDAAARDAVFGLHLLDFLSKVGEQAWYLHAGLEFRVGSSVGAQLVATLPESIDPRRRAGVRNDPLWDLFQDWTREGWRGRASRLASLASPETRIDRAITMLAGLAPAAFQRFPELVARLDELERAAKEAHERAEEARRRAEDERRRDEDEKQRREAELRAALPLMSPREFAAELVGHGCPHAIPPELVPSAVELAEWIGFERTIAFNRGKGFDRNCQFDIAMREARRLVRAARVDALRAEIAGLDEHAQMETLLDRGIEVDLWPKELAHAEATVAALDEPRQRLLATRLAEAQMKRWQDFGTRVRGVLRDTWER